MLIYVNLPTGSVAQSTAPTKKQTVQFQVTNKQYLTKLPRRNVPIIEPGPARITDDNSASFIR